MYNGASIKQKEYMMTRTAVLLAAIMLTTPALATVNTMPNVDEYDNGSTKTCVYSNGHRTETVEISGARACPSKKTFH